MKRFTAREVSCRKPPDVDVHQHLWPPEFVDALRSRSRGAPAGRLDAAPGRRAAVRRRPGRPRRRSRARGLDPDVGRIVLGLSSPLGIEDLPPDDAGPLLLAWHKGSCAAGAVRCLGRGQPRRARPGRLAGHARRGVRRPAGAGDLAGHAGRVEAVAELLRVVRAGRPAGLRPPGPGDHAAPPAHSGLVGARRRLCRAAAGRLVGLASGRPQPAARSCASASSPAPAWRRCTTSDPAARGGPALLADPDTFVDTSSYGRVGLDSLVRVLGVDALVLGSDRPYAVPTDPGLGRAATHAVRVANPRRLLQGGRAVTASLTRRRPRRLRCADAALAALPDRDLDRARAARAGAVARGRAAAGGARTSSFSDDQRHYVQLHRDPHIDVWLLCWTPAQRHRLARPRHLVRRRRGRRGSLMEQVLAVGAPSVADRGARRASPTASGRTTSTGSPAVDAGSVSVHAYSPPLWRMGQYTVSGTGAAAPHLGVVRRRAAPDEPNRAEYPVRVISRS